MEERKEEIKEEVKEEIKEEPKQEMQESLEKPKLDESSIMAQMLSAELFEC